MSRNLVIRRSPVSDCVATNGTEKVFAWSTTLKEFLAELDKADSREDVAIWDGQYASRLIAIRLADGTTVRIETGPRKVLLQAGKRHCKCS